MKKRLFFISLIISFLVFASPLRAIAASKNTQDFYFKDFTADYYLTKDADGISKMHVVEKLTAVFPDYDQNHGIERKIPYTNQNGKNLTMLDFNNPDITVKRNDHSEPFTASSWGNYINVRIGSADSYVHGEQTYTIEYDYVRVITEFGASSWHTQAGYQELYWDVNGTGWSQRFNKVTANIHMDDDIYRHFEKDNNWCYFGREGENNKCSNVTQISDGISYSHSNVSAGQNITFALTFEPDTFVVPEANNQTKAVITDADVHYTFGKNSDGTANLKVKEKLKVKYPEISGADDFGREIQHVNDTDNRYLIEDPNHYTFDFYFDGKKVEDRQIRASTILGNENTIRLIYDSDEDLHGEHDVAIEYELTNIINLPENYQRQGGSLDFIPFFFDSDEETLFPEKSKSDHEKDYQYFAATDNLNLTKVYNIDTDSNLQIRLTVDFDKSLKSQIATQPLCYKSRNCNIEKTDTGYIITARDSHISPYIAFKNGTFEVPDPNYNYAPLIVSLIIIGITLLICIPIIIRAYTKGAHNRRFYKNLPVAPQYQPLKDFTVGQMAEIYTKGTKNSMVATMLDLIVNKKIELIKVLKNKGIFGINNDQWRIRVIDTHGITDDQYTVLKIMLDKDTIFTGDEALLQNHSTSSKRNRWFKEYTDTIISSLRDNHYLMYNEADYRGLKTDSTNGAVIASILIYFIFFGIWLIPMVVMLMMLPIIIAVDVFNEHSVSVGFELFIPAIITVFAGYILTPIIRKRYRSFARYTEEGLKLSNYMEGLKLYIKMAEADRIKFLQSVGTADVSEEGIVKLYEKLLPYASLFGLEKSWMNTMDNYYKSASTTTPDWYTAGLTYSALNHVAHTAITSYSTSTGGGGGGGFSGGGSSSSSGGGGGGSSGGGGGGGGGGGW